MRDWIVLFGLVIALGFCVLGLLDTLGFYDVGFGPR